MCMRMERVLSRGVTASAPTEQHNIHTLKLVERVSVREKGRERSSGRDEKGRTWSVADYRVALTNILHLPSLSLSVGDSWWNTSLVYWLMARDRPSPIGKQRGACRPVLARQHVRATCNRLVGRPVIRGSDTTPCQSETGLQPKRSEPVATTHSLHFSFVFHAS